MKRRIVCLAAALTAICCLTASIQPAAACTGIRIKPQDGSVIVARTLEFATSPQSEIVVIPRGAQLTGTAPGNRPGLRWTVKHAIVGANLFGLPAVLDGMNEKGLAAASFYMPGYAVFPETKQDDMDRTIAPWELPLYLLSNCADVNEAVQTVRNVHVGNVFQETLKEYVPLHFMVSDAGGRCAVFEYVKGGLKIHDNPFGVLTNSPTFDWHMTNLSNYINLSDQNVPPKDVAGVRINSLGQGSGMLGLPGDFTPPSRFVQAVAFSHSILPVATAHEGVLQAFHILNQFDIPRGSARSMEDGKRMVDITQWTSAADLTNHRYYFRTYENSRIRMVDMSKLNLDAKAIKTISMTGPEVIEDVSNRAGP